MPNALVPRKVVPTLKQMSWSAICHRLASLTPFTCPPRCSFVQSSNLGTNVDGVLCNYSATGPAEAKSSTSTSTPAVIKDEAAAPAGPDVAAGTAAPRETSAIAGVEGMVEAKCATIPAGMLAVVPMTAAGGAVKETCGKKSEEQGRKKHDQVCMEMSVLE